MKEMFVFLSHMCLFLSTSPESTHTQSLPKLRELDVSWNELPDVHEAVLVLRKCAPSLEALDTRHNPWAKVRHLRRFWSADFH